MDRVLANWRRFTQGLPVEGSIRSVILESWGRCRKAGVRPPPDDLAFRPMAEGDLARRLKENALVLHCASHHLDRLAAGLRVPHVLCLTDCDGIVLYARGDRALRERLGGVPGCDWSEKRVGTNGAGTALATDQPVEVVGAEHFIPLLQDRTCAGAPLHAPDGRVIAAINLNTSQADGYPERLAWVAHVAYAIDHEVGYRDEMGQELDRTNQALEEFRQRMEQQTRTDQRKDEFLAMLVHDLRNFLAPVRAGLHIMKQLGREDTPVEKVRTIMERQVRHLARFLDDLCDMSQITHGKFHLRKESVDLATVVSEAVEITQHLIERRRHALTVSLPPQPCRLQVDPARLIQVLTNLLNNAAKYTDPGGRICLTGVLEETGVALRVRDTGRGLSADMLGRIFEPFEGCHQAPDHGETGLGVGLTIVRQLVEAHGGTIEAHSTGVGKGSEFTVHLPGIPDREESHDLVPFEGAAGSVGVAPKRRILIIDDNIDAAKCLAMLLRLEGHEVRLAYNGHQGLNAAHLEPPEIMLVDIGMPGMNGYEVAKQARKSPTLEGTLLVALTGYGEESDRVRSRESGFHHHLVKPVDFKELKELLAHPHQAETPGSLVYEGVAQSSSPGVRGTLLE